MKRIASSIILGSFLLFSTMACNAAKTSSEAPNSTENAGTVPDTETARNNQEDGTSEVRRAQANADIRAREQRNNIGGDPLKRADGDLQSEVRSKLEVNIPASQLTVEAKDGVVTVSGTVPTQEQLDKIQPLAMEIKGVKSVDVKATVAPATPTNNEDAGKEQ